MRLLTITLLIVAILAQQVQNNKVQDVNKLDKKKAEDKLIKNYNDQAYYGIIVLGVLMGIAYAVGKTGRHFIYNQIESQVKNNKEIEEQNQTTDNTVIQNDIDNQKENPQINELNVQVPLFNRVKWSIVNFYDQFKLSILKKSLSKNEDKELFTHYENELVDSI
ncbi:hypothetical protein pb186bvf_002433 [Paramecium bursaria]